ncbi:hypothetical protein C3495_03595 [Clostridiaceae bacterium 14S0207]|nr:hypothetical protein C3495_03595 [Clostridiaceae bacterium 14S0207]
MNNKVIRKVVSLLAIVCIGLLGGCSSKGNEEVKEVSMNTIVEKVKGATDSKMFMEEKEEGLERFYDIKKDDIEEFALFLPSKNIQANEIAILKLKSSEDVEKIKEKINKRIEDQSNAFKQYIPEQYDIIKNNEIVQKGKYILFVADKNKDKVKSAFEESFK